LSLIFSRSRLYPPPHPPRRLDHALELVLLLILAEITDEVGGEAALRADRELIERQDLRGFIDATLERRPSPALAPLVLTRPGTTTLPLGKKRSGAKLPVESIAHDAQDCG
jgi:hypothetical protein